MRILFHHRVASRDGQSVHIEEMIKALQQQGHETVLIGPAAFTKTGFGGSNPVVDRIKRSIPAALYEVLEIAYNLKAFLRLHAAVRRYRPDFIYERFSLFLFAGIWVRRLTGLPLLLEVNSPLYEERMRNDGLRLLRFGRWAQRLIWNRADHVLPVTAVLGRTVAEYGVPCARITVIPNGINPERFQSVPDTETAKLALGVPGRLVLGFAGFFREWNGVDRLVAFVARYGAQFDLHLLIVGDGPVRQSLEEQARAQGVHDRLTITGIVSREEMARHIAAFDIAVVPAVTPYSSPLKLFEYLYLGRAIVGPNDENIREILSDEGNALLFEAGRDSAMDTVLLRLCKDRDLRIRLGAAARRTIATRSLTWGHNARRMVEIAARKLRRHRAHHIDVQDRSLRNEEENGPT